MGFCLHTTGINKHSPYLTSAHIVIGSQSANRECETVVLDNKLAFFTNPDKLSDTDRVLIATGNEVTVLCNQIQAPKTC